MLIAQAAKLPSTGVHFSTGDTLDGAGFVPYRCLLDEARRVHGGLRAAGRRPGDRVLLILERPRDFVMAFWGCVLAGLIPCPILPLRADPGRWTAQLAHVGALLDDPLILTGKCLHGEIPAPAGLSFAVLEELASCTPAPHDHQAGPDDPALLMLTSGSTRAPKAVRLTHRNLLAAMAGKAAALGLTGRDVCMNWIAFDHIAAFEGHLLPLWCGAEQVQVSPEVILDDPARFLTLIGEHRISHTFAPNFLLGQLNKIEPPAGPALSTLRTLISGGESVVCATALKFLARYASAGLSHDVLRPGFGMTETCAGSIFSDEFPAADAGYDFAGLGRPVPGLEMRVVDAGGRPLPAGRKGELQVRGPMVTGGYLNNPEADREAFTADGWFRTGDLGIIDGGLRLAGRSKDSVIVNGVNYYSHDLEAVLDRLDGVARSSVAAFPTRPPGGDTEQLVVVFTPAVSWDDDAELHRVLVAIRTSTVMHWGFRPAAILPLPPEEIPKTSLGKIPRSLLRRRLEAGAYAGYQRRVADLTARMLGGYVPPEGAAEQRLTEIYAEMFGLEPEAVSATASFFDLGGTSLDILRLKHRVQQRFGLADLPVIWILLAPTVRGLARRLAEPGGAGGRYDPLVPLQLSGDRTPLFCVHPGVGEVLVFVNLAKYFAGVRPFYALRARGFGEGEPYFRSFAEMVDCYVAAIRERQPAGPYAIAGYSYGGAVAFEIAKALEAAGERVDFVGIFNLPPYISARMRELDQVEGAANLAFFLSLITKEQAAELSPRLRALPWPRPLEYLIDLASPERLAELDLDLPKFTAWAELAQSLIKVGRTYTPSGNVRSVTVFYATPLRGTKEEWLRDQLSKWDDFTRGPNRYVEVPGEHYTLMGPDHVTTLQAILHEELDRALGGSR
jgi:acyl-CoA synthetase (AMP-forming)/AMP-acid ligase II/thioesterase domain-containing protein